jgi:hypothetical protein
MLSIYSMAEWEVKIQRDFIDAGTHEWCGDGLFKSFERIGKC